MRVKGWSCGRGECSGVKGMKQGPCGEVEGGGIDGMWMDDGEVRRRVELVVVTRHPWIMMEGRGEGCK